MMLESAMGLKPESTPVVILAGGEGSRLKSVTGDALPKVLVPLADGRAMIDHVVSGFQSAGFEDFIFSLGKLSEQVLSHLEGQNPKFRFSIRDGVHDTTFAVKKAIEDLNITAPLIVACGDMLHPWQGVKEMCERHQSGSFTWGVTGEQHPLMKSYAGLYMDESTGAVIGDKSSKWWREEDEIPTGENVVEVVKGGVIIVEKAPFYQTDGIFRRAANPQGEVDMWWHILSTAASLNKTRIKRGQTSLVNGVDLKGPIYDAGTPERLAFINQEVLRT